MFDPEEDRAAFKLSTLLPKHPTRPISPPSPPLKPLVPPPSSPTLSLKSADEILHDYMDMSESFRRLHGFSRQKGLIYLVDKAKVDALDPVKKQALRAWVELKRKEKIWGGTKSS